VILLLSAHKFQEDTELLSGIVLKPVILWLLCPTDLTVGDKDHEGHSVGLHDIANSISGWLNTQQPDIITLMIGRNDILDNFDVSAAPARLSALIDQITNLSLIPICSIPPSSDATINQQVLAFNSTYLILCLPKGGQGKISTLSIFSVS